MPIVYCLMNSEVLTYAVLKEAHQIVTAVEVNSCYM